MTDIGTFFTWIKADPTFEGLKQIIYEPQERVRIQAEDPSESETYTKIEKAHIQLPTNLKISDESGEKTNFCICDVYDLQFSNNLTCIIGGRGSGKSTIAHLIYNKQSPDTETLKRIDSPLLNLDLPPSPLRIVANSTDCDVPIQAEFFFQNQIEQAAKSIEQMSELIRRRLEKLSSIGGEGLEKKRLDWKASSNSLNTLIDAYDQIAYLDSQISLDKNSIKTLRKQTQIITSEEYKGYQDEIGRITSAISDFNSYQEEYNLLNEQITAIKATIDKLKWDEKQGKEIIAEFKDNLSVYEGKITEEFTAYKAVYDGRNFAEQLDEKKEQLKSYLQNKGLAPENIQELANANQEISELQQNIDRLESKKQPYLEIYQQKSRLIENYKLAYTDYKDKLDETASSLQSRLTGLQSTQKEIRFEINIDEAELKKQICDFVKGMLKDETILKANVIERVIFANGNSQEYATESNKIREQVNQSTVAEKHTEILKELINDDVFLERLHLRVVKYCFDINNLRVQTKLGGTLLNNTSFGERCGIAIAIILAAGTNPVLIDQPEDHLDGKFISTILVPLIRKQKHNRQIILITRDANIVIGGDTELMHILESTEQRTEICPSTIENTDKRESYIWILDGGEEAFMKRERKYDFD